ncbi:MAG TPA: hypothetical protein DHV48_03805 [Prolixibacteraceae bacterium]|nr:MAG: hypothetical protein A2066_05630 [Bacteroidetes bacterium GWB2_41_8]HCY40466.1 hypothetical protein [Prolixibacteraceae bacterium]
MFVFFRLNEYFHRTTSYTYIYILNQIFFDIFGKFKRTKEGWYSLRMMFFKLNEKLKQKTKKYV